MLQSLPVVHAGRIGILRQGPCRSDPAMCQDRCHTLNKEMTNGIFSKTQNADTAQGAAAGKQACK
jgi:hypothetical protein